MEERVAEMQDCWAAVENGIRRRLEPLGIEVRRVERESVRAIAFGFRLPVGLPVGPPVQVVLLTSFVFSAADLWYARAHGLLEQRVELACELVVKDFWKALPK